MTITYDETFNLMRDATFNGRVQVSCLHFAAYINGEPDTTPAHQTRFRWAQECFANPAGPAGQIMPVVVMDTKVQAAGGSITDADLQSAVETAVNALI